MRISIWVIVIVAFLVWWFFLRGRAAA